MAYEWIRNLSQIKTELARRDEKLDVLFRLVGDVAFAPRGRPFESLVLSVIGQQLSTKAAATIRKRVRELCGGGEITPEAILSLEFSRLREAGVSAAKIACILDLAGKVKNGQIGLDTLDALDNRQIIDQLTQVKGIGRWTAEMFLIFSLGRPNVLSAGDFGLQRAVKWLYQMEERADGKYLQQHGDRGDPWQSVVSLHLWQAIDLGFVDSGRSPEELLAGR